jgi:hypothetical protein
MTGWNEEKERRAMMQGYGMAVTHAAEEVQVVAAQAVGNVRREVLRVGERIKTRADNHRDTEFFQVGDEQVAP